MNEYPLLLPTDTEEDIYQFTRFGQQAIARREDAVDAAGKRATYFNPWPSLVRGIELERARNAEDDDEGTIDVTEWPDSEFYRPGLEFPSDKSIVNRSVARMIAERFDERQKFDSILARSPSDFGTGARMMGKEFMVGLMDPLNIASAFIPVTLPVRFMAPFGSSVAGRAAGAAVQGFVGGAAGAAMIEPFVLATARAEQADYDAYDSMMNIAFGGVTGAGFNVALRGPNIIRNDPRVREQLDLDGNVIASRVEPTFDPWRPAPTTPGGQGLMFDPASHSAAMRVAVAQVLTGRQVDVDGLADLDDKLAQLSGINRNQSNRYVEFMGVADKAPRRYETQKGAKAAITALRKKGVVDPEFDLQVKVAGDGFVITTNARATLARNETGEVQMFTTPDEAMTYGKANLGNVPGVRPVRLTDTASTEPRYGLIRNSTPQDVARYEAYFDAARRDKTLTEAVADAKAGLDDGAAPLAKAAETKAKAPLTEAEVEGMKAKARANHETAFEEGFTPEEMAAIKTTKLDPDNVAKALDSEIADLEAVVRNSDLDEEMISKLQQADAVITRSESGRFKDAVDAAASCVLANGV